MNYFLRGLTEKDKDILFQWRNKESIRVNMYHDQPISYEQHCQWFENVLQNESDFYRLFIHQNTPLGHISFKNINHQHQTCSWGFYIGEENAPKGSGTVMGYLALDYAFYHLKMRKVIGEVLAFNKKSAGFHQKMGFFQEGCFKKEINRNGQFIDVIRLALFEEDWKNRKKQLNVHFSAKERSDEGN